MLTPMSATYPTHRESTVVLRDGSTLTIRPVRVEDAPELGRFFADLSLESRVFRFFAAVVNADNDQLDIPIRYNVSCGQTKAFTVEPIDLPTLVKTKACPATTDGQVATRALHLSKIAHRCKGV